MNSEKMKVNVDTIITWVKTHTTICIIAVIAIVGVIIFVSNKGYSKNVQEVRSWQNAILRDKNVTLGEVMDFALYNSNWSDVQYNGEDAVQLTGIFKDSNKTLRAVFYVNRKNGLDVYAYYEKDGVKGTPFNIAFEASNYADAASKALGRTR